MLKVYAHPASQPSRTVIWACVLSKLPIELIADTSVIGSVNPRGQIPVIDDEGFLLAEMPAILSYLGAKHGWTRLYPDDLQIRGRIAQYLHSHHDLTRLATLKLMAPHVLIAFEEIPTSNPLSHISNTCIEASIADEHGLQTGQALLTQVIEFIETAYLANQDFIAGTADASIADLACYEEIGQLQPAGLFDLSEHKVMSAWSRRMEALPWHEEIHRFNRTLGDIRIEPNTMERFMPAIAEGLSALAEIESISMEGQ